MNQSFKTKFRTHIISTASLALLLTACGTNNDPEEEATSKIAKPTTNPEIILPTPEHTLEVAPADISVAGLATNQQPENNNILAGSSWQIEDVDSGGIIDKANLTVNFGEEGWVSGSSGCNSYTGGYSVNGYELELGELAATMMACPEAIMDLESKFLDVLGGAIDFSIDGQRSELTITAWDGRNLKGVQIQ